MLIRKINREMINIEDEIINKRIGSHYIKLSEEENLKYILKRLKEDDLFNVFEISYTYVVKEEYILLILHRQFDFF